MFFKKKDKGIPRVASFEKVSFEQFTKDYRDAFPDASEQEIKTHFVQVKMPVRATEGSAGYDFYSTCDFKLQPGETIKILTGIRSRINPGWALLIYPRSGLGFKFRLQLNNTVGVIDSDYYNAENEGHIQIKITNDSKEGKVLEVKEGTAFAQGIFTPFGITENDSAQSQRTGGFGSTDKKN